MLPQDLLDLIAMFSGSYRVIRTLKTSPSITFHQKNVSLVYGQVQSGKTSMIFNLIQQSTLPCVLIIQNSLLVLQQYKQRMDTQRISYSTVYQQNPSAKVTILMNNSHQYSKYIPPLHFSLIMDESDLTRHNPLLPLSTNQFHVTATPFRYKPIFDRIIRITPPEDYYGIEKVNYLNKPYDECGTTDYVPIVDDFTANDGGILLISEFNFVSEMHSQAGILSLKFDLPILVLSTQKKYIDAGSPTWSLKIIFLRLSILYLASISLSLPIGWPIVGYRLLRPISEHTLRTKYLESGIPLLPFSKNLAFLEYTKTNPT